jgi:hypothetical protein
LGCTSDRSTNFCGNAATFGGELLAAPTEIRYRQPRRLPEIGEAGPPDKKAVTGLYNFSERDNLRAK